MNRAWLCYTWNNYTLLLLLLLAQKFNFIHYQSSKWPQFWLKESTTRSRSLGLTEAISYLISYSCIFIIAFLIPAFLSLNFPIPAFSYPGFFQSPILAKTHHALLNFFELNGTTFGAPLYNTLGSDTLVVKYELSLKINDNQLNALWTANEEWNVHPFAS